MHPEFQERHNNTVQQVEEYLLAALKLVEAINPPDDLRVEFFKCAVQLYSGKQLMVVPPKTLPVLGVLGDGLTN